LTDFTYFTVMVISYGVTAEIFWANMHWNCDLIQTITWSLLRFCCTAIST